MATTDAPILNQSVRWGENYVSRALNLKFAGIISPGIYQGFILKPGGNMTVMVANAPDYPRSVAVIERDDYSLTITMDDPGLVPIPAPGRWHICIEAFYAPTQQGYQRIVAREKPESHHAVLGIVDTGEAQSEDGAGIIITESMISTAGRTIGATDALIKRLADLSVQIEQINDLFVQGDTDLAGQLIRLANRVTHMELNQIALGAPQPFINYFLPAGGIGLGNGVRIAPLTIAPEGINGPQNAAFTMVVSDYKK